MWNKLTKKGQAKSAATDSSQMNSAEEDRETAALDDTLPSSMQFTVSTTNEEVIEWLTLDSSLSLDHIHRWFLETQTTEI